MTDTPEPTQPTPPQPAPAPSAPRAVPWLPILIGVAVVAVLLAGFAAWRMQSGRVADDAYVVEAFTPTTELISARERVPGYDAPDTASAVAVEFGASVTLNVTGRVSRGLGGDWYQVAWNERVVFVRTQDVTAGSGAPPVPVVREDEPEELIEEELKPDPLDEDSEPVVEAPFTPSGRLSMGDVRWERAPNARDFARFYPDDALDAGQSGSVTLDCIIGGGGRLACSVGHEDPQGYGFGRAAINISRQLRVDTRLPDGSSASGRNLSLPLSFRAG